MISISDRELLSVLWFLRACPAGEEEMSIGLRMYELFDFGAAKWAMPDEGAVDLARFSDEARAYDLSQQDALSLRAILSRPGQAPAMWLSSARCLRRLKEAAEPKALTSVP